MAVVGEVITVAGMTMPTGFIPADGALYNDAEYPDLATELGQQYSEALDAQGTFRVPDLRDRVVVGLSSNNDLGDKFGEDEVTLTANQMPRHNHNSATSYAEGTHRHTVLGTDNNNFQGGGSKHGVSGALGSDAVGETNIAGSGEHRHNIAMDGDDDAHENRQPSIVLRKLICAEV